MKWLINYNPNPWQEFWRETIIVVVTLTSEVLAGGLIIHALAALN